MVIYYVDGAIIGIIFVALIIMGAIGVGIGTAVLTPIMKTVCHISLYVLLAALIIVAVKECKENKEKGYFWIFCEIVFNFVLCNMAFAIVIFPIYTGLLELLITDSLVEYILFAMGFVIVCPLVAVGVTFVLIPYISVIVAESDKSQKLLLFPAGILSFVLLIILWFGVMYYGHYKSGLPSEDMSYIKTAFEIYPFGIRKMMEMILINGGEFVRSLLV